VSQGGAVLSERIRSAAARWPRPNPQELDHLEDALSRLNMSDCFAVLAESFGRPGGADAQEYASRLFLRLKPPFPDDVTSTMALLLSHWDVSVEQLVWYVDSVVDRQVLAAALADVAGKSEAMRRAVETFQFWLRIPSDQRRVK